MTMMKKLLIASFGLIFSVAAFADFTGQTVTVEYVTATEPGEDPLTIAAQDTTSVAVPGTTTFNFDGNVNCDITITANVITVGNCDFGPFGNAGGITFNGFRFTQDAAAPDITGPAPNNADSIAVNLIGQTLTGTTTATVTVTFAAAPASQAIPAVAPLGLWLLGLLLAGVGYRAHRRR